MSSSNGTESSTGCSAAGLSTFTPGRSRERTTMSTSAYGWRHAPETGEDGYTGYERGAARLELAFLARDEDGQVHTPLREGRAAWPDEAFETDIAELRGVRARVISLRALKAEKAEVREDSIVAAKDRADSVTLSRFS